MKELIAKAEQTHTLLRGELIALLEDDGNLDAISAAADRVRHKFVGDEVHLRALIEFSNFCKNNCCYCGLRRDNKKLTRYRLNENMIFNLAEYAVKQMGLKTIVLQSGEDMFFDCDKMCAIIRKIKTLDTALTLSIGEKEAKEYKAYKEAGADRYLLRIETSDKALYESVHPNMSFENRIRCLHDLKSLGYELGTGCLVGLPHQTSRHLAGDILFFKEIEADMIGIGPYIPHPQTPLRNEKGGDLMKAVKVMALTRLLLPTINIPATTAMETLAPNGQAKALRSGANVIMPNAADIGTRRRYDIYPGKTPQEPSEDARSEAIEKILRLGRTLGQGYGTSRHLKG